jgi:hypothetical protein
MCPASEETMPMARIRPNRVPAAAGTAAAIFVLTTWAGDPAWARAAGLDVWNVGRLEDQLRASRAEAVRLENQEAAYLHQYEVNRLLVLDVAAGRRPLAEAADALWGMNKDRPGYAYNLDRNFRGPTVQARAAHHILYRIAMEDDLPPAEKAAALARLRPAYAAAFGAPAPDDGT